MNSYNDSTSLPPLTLPELRYGWYIRDIPLRGISPFFYVGRGTILSGEVKHVVVHGVQTLRERVYQVIHHLYSDTDIRYSWHSSSAGLVVRETRAGLLPPPGYGYDRSLYIEMEEEAKRLKKRYGW